MTIPLAPIVLFAYERLWHTQQTVEALQRNILADLSDLIIFSDAAKNKESFEKVTDVRRYLNTINGFKSVTIIEREKNLGLAASIIDGVTEVVNRYGSVIVLEDDIVTSPYFLQFMNEALFLYKDINNVMHISGYMFPVDPSGLPDTFFYRSPSCWGWATWKESWSSFKRDVETIVLSFTKDMKHKFNIDGGHNFWKQIKDNYSGKLYTWAIFWYASVFINNGLCLHPTVSLTHNIGHDETGVHCIASNHYDVILADKPVLHYEMNICENKMAVEKMIKFYQQISPSIIYKAYFYLKHIFSKWR